MARQTRKKTWTQKRDSSRLPEVKILQSDFAGLKQGTSMVISSPTEIDAYIRAIPYGSACTVDTLRNALAERHGADAACPASTAIFLRIVAEAAWEALQSGAQLQQVTPFWRVVEPGSKLARKLSVDPAFLSERRDQEGIGRS